MLKVKESLKVKSENQKDIRFLWLLSAAAAFAASFGKTFGYSSAMNVAVSVISGFNFIPAFLGSALSYLFQGSWVNGASQLASMLVIGLVRGILSERKYTEKPGFSAILTSGILLLFSGVIDIATGASGYTIAMSIVNALFCGVVVFISKVILYRRDYEGVVELSGVNGVYGAVIYIAIISTLCSLPIPAINIGRAIGCFAVLCGVRKYRNAGGAVMGAITTCGILLCSPSLAKNSLLLATSGLICGAFIQYGTLATIVSFLGVSFISLAAIGINSDTFFMFADMLIGSALFVAVPDSFIKKISGRIIGARNSVDLVGQTACSRLNFASKTLSDIRSQLSLISSAIERKTKKADLKKRVCLSVCGDCPMYTGCWKSDEPNTMNSFCTLEKIVESSNCLSLRDIKQNLPLCIRPEDVETSFNEIYKEQINEIARNVKIKEMRELLGEQLSSIENILGDLSYRVGQVRTIDSNLSSQVRDYFDRLGYPNAKVCVYKEVNRNICAEIFITSDFVGDIVKMTAKISAIADCDFGIPTITKADGLTRIFFTLQPSYEIEVGSFQASSQDNELSGDCIGSLSLSNDEKYIILSDGMGTGKPARLDSLFTVNLIKRLLKTGASMTTAHKMINSMLCVKGWDESFATLDLLKFDLCGGAAEILKSGAAPSYLYRDGNLISIGGKAFPAGILNNCIPDVSNFKIFYEDIIIMCSDGTDEDTVKYISDAINHNPGANANDLALYLGEKATEKAQNKRRDDITLIVIKIKKADKF
ncbi:MAG: SpoIIE family protein phosphatase [Oscillospiraceae bacterium]